MPWFCVGSPSHTCNCCVLSVISTQQACLVGKHFISILYLFLPSSLPLSLSLSPSLSLPPSPSSSTSATTSYRSYNFNTFVCQVWKSSISLTTVSTRYRMIERFISLSISQSSLSLSLTLSLSSNIWTHSDCTTHLFTHCRYWKRSLSSIYLTTDFQIWNPFEHLWV